MSLTNTTDTTKVELKSQFIQKLGFQKGQQGKSRVFECD